MKYLIFLLLLTSCTKPKTIESCMEEVKEKINLRESAKNDSEVDQAFEEFGIYAVCNDSDNDSEKALIKLKQMGSSK